jgi:hypothetical protein
MRAIAPISFAFTILLVLAASPARADRVYANPQVNGATVDNCATWANDCGWGGAHQYCRTQGHAAARSFRLNNPGRTWVIGSQRYCDGAGCVGFSEVVCMSAPTVGGGDMTFNAPQVNGAAVDNCAVWGNDCGWGGAHQYCRTQGYAAAKSWSLYNPGRTWVIGSQRFCEGAGCVGFSQVVCTNGAGQQPPPPVAGNVLTGPWQGYCGTYEIQQNGNTFTWYCPSTQERAQGTINGNTLSATWTTAGGGGGTATGTITRYDASGRAIRIEWSNGQVFSRN